MTPGFLPFALRASLRLFKIVPDDFVEPRRWISPPPTNGFAHLLLVEGGGFEPPKA